MSQLFGASLPQRVVAPPGTHLPKAVILAIALACGCGGSRSAGSLPDRGPGQPAPADAGTEDGAPGGREPGEPAAAGTVFNLPADISAWKTWNKVGELVAGRGHGESFAEIWVHGGAEAYKALEAGASAPQGMVVVMAQHDVLGGRKGQPRRLAVMAKMEDGFAPDHGDWYYGLWSYDGTRVAMEGKGDGDTELCLTCHDTADTDYLFGLKD